jgi:hypothetical protein
LWYLHIPAAVAALRKKWLPFSGLLPEISMYPLPKEIKLHRAVHQIRKSNQQTVAATRMTIPARIKITDPKITAA